MADQDKAQQAVSGPAVMIHMPVQNPEEHRMAQLVQHQQAEHQAQHGQPKQAQQTRGGDLVANAAPTLANVARMGVDATVGQKKHGDGGDGQQHNAENGHAGQDSAGGSSVGQSMQVLVGVGPDKGDAYQDEDKTKSSVCPECNKTFKHPAWMRKHLVKHRPSPHLQCPNDECHKTFKTQTSLRAHIRTLHEGKFRYTCPICHKGFQDRRKMAAHHRAHNSEQPDVQASVGRVMGDVLRTLLEERAKRLPQAVPSDPAAAPAAAMGVPTCDVCHLQCEDQLSKYITFIRCHRCQFWFHLHCVGVPCASPTVMSSPMCPDCLEAQGKARSTLASVVVGQRLVEAFARQRSQAIVPGPPNTGWSFLNAIVLSISNMTREELLQRALTYIRESMELVELPHSSRVEVKDMANSLLGLTAPELHEQVESAQITTTPLWTVALPRAVSHVIQTPIHILEGDVLSSRVSVVAIQEDGLEHKPPICVMLSCKEFDFPTFDLVATPRN
eukprot:m.121824 g.121824  ORF g.121824 m.121824 type:complete len:500 (+) comp13709_c0_seq1:118-1617(+)